MIKSIFTDKLTSQKCMTCKALRPNTTHQVVCISLKHTLSNGHVCNIYSFTEPKGEG